MVLDGNVSGETKVGAAKLQLSWKLDKLWGKSKADLIEKSKSLFKQFIIYALFSGAEAEVSHSDKEDRMSYSSTDL